MSLENYQVAETFCRHKFDLTYPYMADDIQWTVINRNEHKGREAVMAQCAQAKKFLATVTTTRLELKVIQAGATVVVEGAAQFQGQDNQVSNVTSCDVFQFSGEQLVAITSYVLDLNEAWASVVLQRLERP